MASVVVVCEDIESFSVIQSTLQTDYRIERAANKDAASEIIKKTHPNFIFTDIDFLQDQNSGLNPKWALQHIWSLSPTSDVIVMTSKEMIREAVKAVRSGASEYITYPITWEEIRHVIDSINGYVTLESELDYLRDKFWSSDSIATIQTEHLAMREVYEKIRLVAPTKTTVLLTGETGTGKGVLSKLIHQHSNRKDAQFIQVHCGAIPDTLIESELFGHEKGAFTGADRRKLGKFEIAHGGTIFLDEIGTLTPPAQIKLLQVLQEGIFQRVGGEESIEVDVRIISATNTDLKTACDQGQFRKDLYYRLNVFSLETCPLRERINDIIHFADVFLGKLERTGQKGIHGVHPEVIQAFKKYPWPGNIRELENLIERAYILGRPPMLTSKDFPEEIIKSESLKTDMPSDSSLSLSEARRRAADAAESRYIRDLLARYKGKIQDSAAAAGITTRQLNKIMVKHNISKKEFKSK